MTTEGRTPEGPRTGTQAVERAMGLLHLLGESTDDAGVTALACAAGLSVSTTHRLLAALAAAGLVGQDRSTERYHLGAALIALGSRAEARLGLARWHGELRRLADVTAESVSLGTRVGDEVVIVDHVPSTQELRFDAGVGRHVPIHASAMGKVLLALADDRRREVAGLGPLRRFTDRTLITADELAAELSVIRQRGWALNDGERNSGVRAVAVALPTIAGAPSAALAVQGPEVRLTDERVGALAELLLDTVRSALPASNTS